MSRRKDPESPPSRQNDIQIPPGKLKIVPVTNSVFFPHTSASLSLANPELARKLVEEKYFIIIHVAAKHLQVPPIGTLAVVEEADLDQGVLDIILHRRIEIGTTKQIRDSHGNYFEGTWSIPQETEVTEELWQDGSTMEVVMVVKSLFEDFLTGVEERITAILNAGGDEAECAKATATIEKNRRLSDEFGQITRLNTGEFTDCIAGAMHEIYIGLVEHPSDRVFSAFRSLLLNLSAADRLQRLSLMLMTFVENIEFVLGPTSVSQIPLDMGKELSRPREIPHDLPKVPVLGDHIGFTAYLSPEETGPFKKQVIEYFDAHLVNQEQAKQQIARKLLALKVGAKDPGRAQSGGLFCGPTGVGKTESIKVLAQFLFGDPQGYTHIACEMLKERHQSSSLLGSPPGYIGYDEEPRFSQWNLDRPHVMKLLRDKYKENPDELGQALETVKQLEEMMRTSRISQERQSIRLELQRVAAWKPGNHPILILFDEIEKANPETITSLMIKIFDDGILRLMNGVATNLKNALIFATSNIYGREIAERISGTGMGFQTGADSASERSQLEDDLYRETLNKVMKSFPPEVIGRIGKENIRVLHPFKPEDLLQLLRQFELPKLAARLKEKFNLTLAITEGAELFIVAEATDRNNRTLGARAVHAVMERKIEDPLANLLDCGGEAGINPGDSILIGVEMYEETKKRVAIFKQPTVP